MTTTQEIEHSIAIYLLEKMPLSRESLIKSLESDGMVVKGDGGSEEACLLWLKENQSENAVNLVIIEIKPSRDSNENGIEIAKQIQQEKKIEPTPHILFTTNDSIEEHLSEIIKLRASAIDKNVDHSRLVDIIKRIEKGHIIVDYMPNLDLGKQQKRQAAREKLSVLSKTEKIVACMKTTGHDDNEIREAIDKMGAHVINDILSTIRIKLNLKSPPQPRIQLTRLIFDSGLCDEVL